MAELMQLYLSNRKVITSPNPSRATFIQTTSTTDSRRRSSNKQKTDAVKGENTTTKVEQGCFKCAKTGSSMTLIHRKFSPQCDSSGQFVQTRNTAGTQTYPVVKAKLNWMDTCMKEMLLSLNNCRKMHC